MQMTVLCMNEAGNSELTCIDLINVDYIELENRRIVYHMEKKKYYHLSTLSDLYDCLADYEFDMLDKTNVVNLNKIKKLDEQHGKIYFETDPTKESKYATIALIKQKLFKNDILRKISKNKGMGREFKAPAPGAHVQTRNNALTE